MVRCRDCGSEKVGWDKTKAGHPYLRDFGQPHNNTCPSKNGQKPAKKAPKKDELGLDGNATEAQVRASLNDVNEAMKQSGKVQ